MATTSFDYYEVLEVDRSADGDTIKKSFRRLARQYHPDVNSAPDAEDKFKQINEAYDCLSDPDKRRNYDQFGSANGPSGFGGGGSYQYYNMNDMFSEVDLGDIFSAFFGGVRGSSSGAKVRLEGRDMQMSVSLTLEEVKTGVSKEVTLDRLAPCDECGSTGAQKGTEVQTCTTCKGSGVVTTIRNTLLGAMQSSAVCETCHGTGSYIPSPCTECEGSGRVYDRQQVKVEFPAGIAEGQKIRLKSMGEAGIRGAQAGDLLVVAHIREHDRFERRGSDLLAQLEVSITEASLGADVTTEGLSEEVSVQVFGGSQDGDIIKVKGKGLPRLNSDQIGDLYYQLRVNVPRDLSKRARELMLELSRELGDSSKVDVRPRKKSFTQKAKEKLEDFAQGF